MKNIALLSAIILIIIAAVAIALLTNSSPKLASPGSRNLSFVNVTSVTILFDNLTSVSPDIFPNATVVNRTYYYLPTNTTQVYGVNVPAGGNISINVTTAFTFNGQVIEFISETPGFAVLNSTYLYGKQAIVNFTSTTSTTSQPTTSQSTQSTTSSSTTSTTSTTTSTSTSSSTQSTTTSMSSTSTIMPTTTQTTETTSITPQQTVVPPGVLAGYSIKMSTPRSGYYGNVRIIEVINNADKSKVIISNG